jgi:hypothetical protein
LLCSSVIDHIGVTSAAVHTKNASEKSFNCFGCILVSFTIMLNLSLNNCIIVFLVIQGRIVHKAGVKTSLSLIKKIFSPGHSAINH